MSIGDKLFGGGGMSVTKPLSTSSYADTGSGSTKQAANSSGNPKSQTLSSAAMTPTTFLAGQLGSISFKGPSLDGKLSSLADSPTSDYASGNFSSLAESDRGYVSMPSMSSLDKPDHSTMQGNPASEKPMLVTSGGTVGEEMDVDKAKVSSPNAEKPLSKIDIQDTTRFAGKISTRTLSETSESSLSPAPLSMLVTSPAAASASPSSVPTVAEDIEVMTEYVPSPSSSERLRQDGASGKRSASGLLETDLGPSTKNPRLSPETLSRFPLLRQCPVLAMSRSPQNHTCQR
jgi:hypothetical protein